MKQVIHAEPNQSSIGRPKIAEEQYQRWLDDMRPFLQGGSSLHRAMEKTNLTNHKNRIYQKSKLNDWFRERIDIYQATMGELANETFYLLVTQIRKKAKRGQKINGGLLRTSMRKNEKSIGLSKRKLTARLPNCILPTRNTI